MLCFPYVRYNNTLLKNLHGLQKEGVLCDLLLQCQGQRVIPVHANVMCASSDYFKEKIDHWEVGHSGGLTFCGPRNCDVESARASLVVAAGELQGGCMSIDLSNIPFRILNGIVQFIYVGEFEVERDSLTLVLESARLLLLNDLVILCDHVLKALQNSNSSNFRKSPPPAVRRPSLNHNEFSSPCSIFASLNFFSRSRLRHFRSSAACRKTIGTFPSGRVASPTNTERKSPLHTNLTLRQS